MLKEKPEIFQNGHRIWDVFLTALAFVLAYFIRKDYLSEAFVDMSMKPNYYMLLLLCIMIWYIVFHFTGLYRPYRKRVFIEIALNVLKSVSISLLLLALVLFFSKMHAVSRLFIGIFVLLDIFFLVSSKWIIFQVLGHIRKKGHNFRNILIAGCDGGAKELAQSITERPESGYRIVGCISTADVDGAISNDGCLKVIGDIRDIGDILRSHVVDELIIVHPLSEIPHIGKYIHEAEQMGVSVHIMLEWGLQHIWYSPWVGALGLDNLFGHPALSLTTAADNHPEIFIKNIIDFAGSLIGLLICAIPFLVIGVAIKLTSRGPVFFLQERVGLNGRRFMLYKFRTMFDGADKMKHELKSMNESDGPVFKIRKDPRVIPYVGTFLRMTSIDELPQLINVFKGEMSLVGPRPPLPEEIKEYETFQRRRLSMKPGITCIWQTSRRRNDLSFSEWVKMDLEYIDNWSLGLDLRILLKTVAVVLLGEGR